MLGNPKANLLFPYFDLVNTEMRSNSRRVIFAFALISLSVPIRINPFYSDLIKRWFGHATGLGLSHCFRVTGPGGRG